MELTGILNKMDSLEAEMKIRVINKTLGLVPENEQEKSLLSEFYETGIIIRSFGTHTFGDVSEVRMTIVKSPTK